MELGHGESREGQNWERVNPSIACISTGLFFPPELFLIAEMAEFAALGSPKSPGHHRKWFPDLLALLKRAVCPGPVMEWSCQCLAPVSLHTLIFLNSVWLLPPPFNSFSGAHQSRICNQLADCKNKPLHLLYQSLLRTTAVFLLDQLVGHSVSLQANTEHRWSFNSLCCALGLM